MIQIKEAKSKSEITAFVKFPFTLYKDNPYWVPSIIKEEVKSFDPSNDIFKTVNVKFFLAYKNKEIVGRVACAINWAEVNELHKPKVRFGWFDMIDDIEVTKALINTVIAFGKEHNMQYIEGPMGFSNMDKAGMLTKGFDYIATMIGIYNAEYYPKHLEALGFKPEAEWIEYKLDLQKYDKEKLTKMANLIENRYHVKKLEFRNIKELMPYVDEMFALLNKTYADLQSFVPIQDFQIEHYKKKYLNFIHPDFITCVMDQDNKMIAFAITMPSFSRAFQKAKGKLFPFGFIHLLKATKQNNHAEFYLIGVDPEYRSKGITAIIFREIYASFKKHKIEFIETNPLLIENNKIQALWKNLDPIIHKERKTFRLDINKTLSK
ncbi:GNAT family N-acetyltransferase [Myroides pelagicus]|uniref:GTP cyclohydrolase n=1 Tax=Myroides pelagicus TaxID=270914 RepID=A0A7K1GJM6_9FLAO|nr:GNAT family N-acetyltransferase [Myroides pelagicus]MEC4113811.1 GNAT family N-acetyltransferase [Myroides pelagicus]MTH29081.1 GTP cyclohydrolase [Myroides pelagicus]